MAIFNSINKNSGLVVGVIVVALAFFLLGDAFFGQNSLFSSNKQEVGEIGGKNIALPDYQNELQKQEYEYQIRTGKNIGESERSMVQDQAWNQLIFRYAYQDQFDELGLTVTEKEWEDMAVGENIHPMVKSLFGGNEKFDKKVVEDFLANFESVNPEYKAIWSYVDRNLPQIRLREKYVNLFSKSLYVTQAEAKREHGAQNARVDAQYVYIPLYSVADSTISVSDSELEDYIGKNKEKYKVEEARSLDYVVFAVTPSAEDSAVYTKEMEEIAEDFKQTTEDSTFIYGNSDNPVAPSFKNVAELPESLKEITGKLEIGKVYGPSKEYGKLYLHKVLAAEKDTVSSARASHILFKPATESAEDKKVAKQQASEVLSQIQKGADFKEMAKVHGTDGTATRGGDLGWFTEGQMVKPFNDAVFRTNSAGLLSNLVETQFGYHIIKVTNTKINSKFKIATVEREIGFSEQSRENMYQKATDFASNVEDTTSFRKTAKETAAVAPITANNIKKTDRNINTLMNAREIIRWAYTDGKVNNVSPVFQVDNQFIVAVLTDTREEGTADIESVREEVTAKVREDKKAEFIIGKLKGIEGDDLNAIATKYGNEARVGKAEGVTLASNSIQGIGYDPKATGVLFGLNKDQKSSPFKGENGVVILKAENVTPAPEVADYSEYGNQVKQRRSGRQESFIDESIKKDAEIEDNRYLFY